MTALNHQRLWRIALALGVCVLFIDAVAAQESTSSDAADEAQSASEQAALLPGQGAYTTGDDFSRAYAGEPTVGSPAVSGAAQKKKRDELNTAMKDAYQGVFYANNFDYLDNPLYDGPYFPGDSLKGLAAGKLDLGGEYRSRFHSENNHRGLGLTGRDDEFWLTRLRLFANYRVNDFVRVYGEYLYADSGGENFTPRPIEENRGEAQNLFVDVQLTDELTVRGGRQELLLGNQRLISPLDWANTRRTFDGVRGTYQGADWTVDGFYTRPVARVPATGGTLEWDDSSRQQHFYGVYGTRPGAFGNANLDSYYLGYDDELSDFSYHTLGNRLWGTGDFFLYELEGGVQFGENTDGSEHDAGFVTAGLGRKLELPQWKPTLWFWYDWASGGEQPFGPGDDGFHHLFPLAHKYNGFMDLFGRRNLNDVNVQFIAPVNDKVSLLLWYHYFFLDQATTPYSVVMSPFNTTAPAGSKDLGHEIDLLATVNLNPRNSLLLGYSFFEAGEYYDTTAGVPTNADADFFYCQFQTQF